MRRRIRPKGERLVVPHNEACGPCRDGDHTGCAGTFMIVGLRWNMFRCQCDRWRHVMTVHAPY